MPITECFFEFLQLEHLPICFFFFNFFLISISLVQINLRSIHKFLWFDTVVYMFKNEKEKKRHFGVYRFSSFFVLFCFFKI